MTASFQILSDLHTETGNEYSNNIIDNINPRTDTLILAGDIGSFYNTDSLLNCLRIAAGKFKHVLYVAGNHEYYYSTSAHAKKKKMSDLLFAFKRKVSQDPLLTNVHILDRNIIRLNGVVFAGTTLWTDPRPLKTIPDFIRLGINIFEYEALHLRDARWLSRVEASLDKSEPLVVITHHAPLKSCLRKSGFINKYSSLYTTSFERTRIFKRADVWIYGHTHHNIDKMIGSTRVVTNQAGKEIDPCEADLSKIINI
jgi:predicted phosphodiesterase